MIWKGTQKVGCATHFCAPGTMNSMGSWYTVCNYYPAGMSPRPSLHFIPAPLLTLTA
jgi:hypothetical protein